MRGNEWGGPTPMLIYAEGDLLTSPAQTLVNTVNLVGVMGKGLALKFKQVYPDMFTAYQTACSTGLIGVGRPWLYRTQRKWILNFPTKRHWRQRATIDDIEASLRTFVNIYADEGIISVAFPALGCGNGQLDWNQVRPLMERYLKPLPIQVFVYPPNTAIDYPGHWVPQEIKAWLRSEPGVLPISKVWEDLISAVDLQYEIAVDEMIQPDGSGIRRLKVKGVTSEPIELLEPDMAILWEEIRNRGVLPKSYVIKEHPGIGEFVWRWLRHLPYLEEIVTYSAIRRPEPTLQLRVPPAAEDSVPTIAL